MANEYGLGDTSGQDFSDILALIKKKKGLGQADYSPVDPASDGELDPANIPQDTNRFNPGLGQSTPAPDGQDPLVTFGKTMRNALGVIKNDPQTLIGHVLDTPVNALSQVATGLLGSQKSEAKPTSVITPVKPEEKAKAVAETTTPTLGTPPPTDGNNSLQKIGMLFRGLGATASAFDQGLQHNFSASKPGDELMAEILKEKELDVNNKKLAEQLRKDAVQQDFYKSGTAKNYAEVGNIGNKPTSQAEKEDAELVKKLVGTKDPDSWMGNKLTLEKAQQLVAKRRASLGGSSIATGVQDVKVPVYDSTGKAVAQVSKSRASDPAWQAEAKKQGLRI